MKRIVLACVLVLATLGNALATVVDFEGQPFFAPLSEGYAGFTWNNFLGMDSIQFQAAGFSYSGDSGFVRGAVSGTGTAFSVLGEDASFSRAARFDFQGASLTGAWNNGLQVQVRGYRDGALLYDTTVTANAQGPLAFTFDYQRIDTVSFHSSGGTAAGYKGSGTSFVLDNLQYTVSTVTPAPGAAWLLAPGLAGLLGLRRRFAGR